MCKVTVNGKVCGKVITIHIGNTSNLKNHILNRHGETDAAKELQKYIDEKDADKIRNIVPGNPGKIYPAIPNTKNINPRKTRMSFFILLNMLLIYGLILHFWSFY